MPLYQMVIIARCTHPSLTVQMLKKITAKIWQQGGNVRDVKILTDRLLARQLQAIDGQKSLIGRYTQVLLDGSPYLLNQIRKQARLDKNVMNIGFFKVKDFYSHAQEYHKPIESQIHKGRNAETARKITILKEES